MKGEDMIKIKAGDKSYLISASIDTQDVNNLRNMLEVYGDVGYMIYPRKTYDYLQDVIVLAERWVNDIEDIDYTRSVLIEQPILEGKGTYCKTIKFLWKSNRK